MPDNPIVSVNDESETDDNKLSARLTRDEELTDEEFLSVAKHRFQMAEEAETETRLEELEDSKFMIGDQWPVDIKSQRLLEMRPCLTINRIPQFVRQITNDQRQNRPSIKVNPVDNESTVETAKVLQGMIRHIEYASHADSAYDTAFEGCASKGIGYFRLITDYTDSMSFQQEIKVKLIKDRFSVYTDPFYQEPDGSDMEWGFVFEDISKDEFRAKYPDSKLSQMSDWGSMSSMSSNWVRRDSVRIAEYYYKTYEECDICLLSDGKVEEKEDIMGLPDFKDWKDGMMGLPDGVRVTSERTTLVTKIKWAKINGIDILEETEILGDWIPLIPVIGEEEIVEGRRVLSGIIRHAKDPQRMYNYWASAETETIALAPKSPYIGAEGQFEGYEQQWKTANTKNHAFLEYKLKALGGEPIGPPQRNIQEPPIMAITQARGQCIDDMKGTTGIYDDTLGKRSNSESGVAIQRRNSQSQTGNFHYIDNLSRSLRHAGRIMLNWIPQVYDTAQAVRVIGDDGTVTMEKINQIFHEGGVSKSHFLDHGTYDCTVSTGPGYQTKRQEAVASMLDLSRSMPQAMQFATDLLVRNMDWEGSSEIADRLKKMLPPQLADDGKDQPPLPPQIQAQMKHMGDMITTLTEQNKEYIEQIRTKGLEIASKERIVAMEQKTQLAIELMKHDQKDAALIFQAEQDHIDRQLAMDQQAQQNQSMNPNSGSGPQGSGQPQMNQPNAGPQAAQGVPQQ